MSAAEMEMLPVRTFDPTIDYDTCAVCQQDFVFGMDRRDGLDDSKDDVVRSLLCQHIFHQECIDPWLAKHRTCPICMKDAIGMD